MKEYSSRQIAEIMQVPAYVVREWVRSGDLECYHDMTWIKVKKKDFRTFMRNNARMGKTKNIIID